MLDVSVRLWIYNIQGGIAYICLLPIADEHGIPASVCSE